MNAPWVSVSRCRDPSLQHLLGPAAAAALADAGLAVPSRLFQAAAHASGFVAKTGHDEYLVAGAPLTPPADAWLFARGDCVFKVRGAGRLALFSQICHLDPAELVAGAWLATSAAGITAWCLQPSAATDHFLIGCDPSYGIYLEDTLVNIAQDATPIPAASA